MDDDDFCEGTFAASDREISLEVEELEPIDVDYFVMKMLKKVEYQYGGSLKKIAKKNKFRPDYTRLRRVVLGEPEHE